MGGRWDATSVVSPAVAVITGVGLDHTDRLGSTRRGRSPPTRRTSSSRRPRRCSGPGTAGVADIFLERARVAVHASALRRRAGRPPGRRGRSPCASRDRAARRPGGSLVARRARRSTPTYPGLRLARPSYQAPNVAVAVAAAEAAVGRALDLEALRAALARDDVPRALRGRAPRTAARARRRAQPAGRGGARLGDRRGVRPTPPAGGARHARRQGRRGHRRCARRRTSPGSCAPSRRRRARCRPQDLAVLVERIDRQRPCASYARLARRARGGRLAHARLARRHRAACTQRAKRGRWLRRRA